MTSPVNLSWALRPDPDLGARVVAIWSVGAGEALEIDLMGQARQFRDQARTEWIVIEDDAPSPKEPVDLAAWKALAARIAEDPMAG